MSDDPSLARILRLLDTGKGEEDAEDEESTTRSVRRKNQNDDMEIGGSGSAVQGQRQIIDFEDLVFTQGSHFMANKRCQLPEGSFRKQRKGM